MIPFLLRRSRWMILGWAARKIGRSGFQKTVDKAVGEAAARIDDKLPAPVSKALEKLPGDATRAGGALLVAGQGARSAGSAVKSVADSGRRLNQRRRSGQESVSGRVHELRDEIAIESDEARRRIRSDMLRETHGEGAALDALLDLRPSGAGDEPLPEVPPEVAKGRRRSRPALPVAPVNRMRRSYRQASKPWDRPLRRR